MNLTRTLAWALAVAVAVIAGPAAPLPATAQSNETVHVRLFPAFNNLPIYIAYDKGYFAKEHLDVQIAKINTAPSAMIPAFTHGDVDIAPLQLSPAFFNQFAEGFNVQLVSSLAGPHKGWNDTVYFMARQDLWDGGAHSLADLKGKTVDVASSASTLDFIFRRGLDHYRLKPADFVITTKFHSPGDWFTAFRNKAVDAMPIVEPMGTEMETQGLAHKVFALADVAPWYQDTFIAVAPDFAKNHRKAVVGFLRALIHAQHDVYAAGNAWTPEFVDEVAKWTEIPADVIRKMIGPAYTGDFGRISTESITRLQQSYADLGVIPKTVPIQQTIDLGPWREASGSR